MGTKPNAVKLDITPPITENSIDTVKKQKITSIQNKIDKPSSNKSDKVKSLDKSRSTQITETEDTVKETK